MSVAEARRLGALVSRLVFSPPVPRIASPPDCPVPRIAQPPDWPPWLPAVIRAIARYDGTQATLLRLG